MTRLTLTLELECEGIEAHLLRRALRDHPGAPLMMRHYAEEALERVLRDVHGAGAWTITVVRGELHGPGPDAQ